MHQKRECGKEPSFSCPHCPYRSKQKSHMKRHVRCKHWAPEWTNCSYSQLQPQPQTSALDVQRPGTFPGQFKCHLCGKVYRWKGNLVSHLRLECGKDPQQQCPLCPTRFKHKSHLTRHIKRRHN
ncbi:hypothetical protein ONE63_006216 [Megalurothrips usitatus]|uniref:C2H2-type domain-containing protein n=1 Tax=Megalurothrips usitatus TaxID=439358 RepID=A0AAV7XWW2_9NEOP|nr:hypothetical protein ONE63_006216 [Megalurothrips usitatus]